MNRSARELSVTVAGPGVSELFVLQPGETADYSVAGTFVGTSIWKFRPHLARISQRPWRERRTQAIPER